MICLILLDDVRTAYIRGSKRQLYLYVLRMYAETPGNRLGSASASTQSVHRTGREGVRMSRADAAPPSAPARSASGDVTCPVTPNPAQLKNTSDLHKNCGAKGNRTPDLFHAMHTPNRPTLQTPATSPRRATGTASVHPTPMRSRSCTSPGNRQQRDMDRTVARSFLRATHLATGRRRANTDPMTASES